MAFFEFRLHRVTARARLNLAGRERIAARANERKVRSPQGNVPANGRGGPLKGVLTESATENIPPERSQDGPVRVKWCGKSAPRTEQSGWQGKPHAEQDQIGEEERPAPSQLPGRSLRFRRESAGARNRSVMNDLDEWLSPARVQKPAYSSLPVAWITFRRSSAQPVATDIALEGTRSIARVRRKNALRTTSSRISSGSYTDLSKSCPQGSMRPEFNVVHL